MGLDKKAIHAAFQCVAAVLVEGVGGHGKDWELCPGRVIQCADLPGGGVAVHHRHLHIHQHQIIAARRCGAHLFHRHFTVFRRIDPEAVLAQDLLRDLAVQLVVLYQQDVSVLKSAFFSGRSSCDASVSFWPRALIRVSRRSDKNMGLEQKAVTPAAFASTSMSDQS